MLHSAAAILKMAEMDYNGANSIFMKTLLDKKYALPYRVIDAVVFHFLGYVFILYLTLCYLTHCQKTNFRLFQTERVCRRQSQI